MSDEAMEALRPGTCGRGRRSRLRPATVAVYSEEEFTRIVLDRLGDEGAIENPTAPLAGRQLRHERSTRSPATRSPTTRNGSMLDDDDLHGGSAARAAFTATKSGQRTSAGDEVLRMQLQGASYKDRALEYRRERARLGRIYEAREQIGVLRVVLLSDGLTGLRVHRSKGCL